MEVIVLVWLNVRDKLVVPVAVRVELGDFVRVRASEIVFECVIFDLVLVLGIVCVCVTFEFVAVFGSLVSETLPEGVSVGSFEGVSLLSDGVKLTSCDGVCVMDGVCECENDSDSVSVGENVARLRVRDRRLSDSVSVKVSVPVISGVSREGLFESVSVNVIDFVHDLVDVFSSESVSVCVKVLVTLDSEDNDRDLLRCCEKEKVWDCRVTVRDALCSIVKVLNETVFSSEGLLDPLISDVTVSESVVV